MRAALVLVALMLAGCAGAPEVANTESEPQDTTPKQAVTIASADLGAPPQLATGFATDAPTRIVSLANGIGETLVALGASDRVIGRDETSDIPELADVPVVTKAHSVSAERVLALKPDLVLVDSATSPPEALDQIRTAGIRVVEVPDAWTVDDINQRLQIVAESIGATGVTQLSFDTDTASDGNEPRVAFLYLRGPSAIYLLGGRESGADALITAAGGIDVGAAADYPAFTPLTAEALVAANPDILLVMSKGLASVGGIDGLLDLPGVKQTTAAANRSVIAVDDGVLLSFGPRTPALIRELRRAIGQLR
jgi:iron complex transport system substrate-binding protein